MLGALFELVIAIKIFGNVTQSFHAAIMEIRRRVLDPEQRLGLQGPIARERFVPVHRSDVVPFMVHEISGGDMANPSADVKALMIMHYYGNIYDKSKDSKEIYRQMKKAGGILTPAVKFEYNKLLKELEK